MEKYIERITGIIPHTHKSVDIALHGKNFIITGGNGSGKTSFLRNAYEKTVLLIVEKKQADLSHLKQNLQIWEKNLAQETKGTANYNSYQNVVELQKREIEKYETGLQIIIPNNIKFSSNFDDGKAVVCYFEDKRLADIAEAKTAQGLGTAIEENRKIAQRQNVGSKLEQHLLNLKTRRSLAITEDKNQELADSIDIWFTDFEKNLKVLFEDESTKLHFDSNQNKFTIQQDNKPAYTFQTLSAGYKAIFDIYADLLMRTEYFKVSPRDLTGTVFIDEIDTHLHVSLQRLILPFFTGSFPQLQFIVTTHSPFVLMSTSETVIFDLGKNEQITDDLSFYTYSSVMEGLLDTKVISVALEKDIFEIANILQSENKDFPRLQELVYRIKGQENYLDSKSKAFFLMGLTALEERADYV